LTPGGPPEYTLAQAMRAERAAGLGAALVTAAIVLLAVTSHAQSRRVEVDPRTGRIVQPSDEKAPAPGADLSTSDEGLVEHAGTSAARGVGVRLQGRFRSNAGVRRGADGRLIEDCVPGAPAAAR
jgi:hypothetical protein